MRSVSGTSGHRSPPSVPLWLLIILVLIGGAVGSFLLLEAAIWVMQAIFGSNIHIWENEFQRDLREYHGEPLRSIMLFFTYLGSFYPTMFVALGFMALLISWHQYREALMIVITTVGAWQLNTLLKSHFMRPRPELEFWTPASGYSFPSGHATIAAAMYGMLFFIWARYRKQQGRPMWPAIVSGICLIVIIGTTRIYLGVHYPTDVLAGFFSGALWLTACAYCLSLWQKRRPQQLPYR